MNNIIKRKWNQNSMVIIEDLQGMAFQAESGGHTFQISGIDGEGNTVALSGTPAGVMLRADGQDVTLTCSVSEGVVSATLPANAYSVPGRFGLTIFLTSDGQKTAIYAAVGTVGKTSSGTVAPPAGSDVVTLVNQINTAIAAIPASYNSCFAPAYSTSGLYSVGQYVTYDGKLYRCNTVITTAETWTAAHWTQTNLGADVYDLNSAFDKETGNIFIQFTDPTQKHYITTNQSVGSTVDLTEQTAGSTQLCYAIVDCSEFDVFMLYGTGGSGGRLWAFIDSSNKMISKANENETANGLMLIAPANSAKLIMNFVGHGTAYKNTNIRVDSNRNISETELLSYYGSGHVLSLAGIPYALGSLDSSGAIISSTTRIVNSLKLYLKKGSVFHVDPGFRFSVARYTKNSDGTFSFISPMVATRTDDYTLDRDCWVTYSLGYTDNRTISNTDIKTHMKAFFMTESEEVRRTKLFGMADGGIKELEEQLGLDSDRIDTNTMNTRRRSACFLALDEVSKVKFTVNGTDDTSTKSFRVYKYKSDFSCLGGDDLAYDTDFVPSEKTKYIKVLYKNVNNYVSHNEMLIASFVGTDIKEKKQIYESGTLRRYVGTKDGYLTSMLFKLPPNYTQEGEPVPLIVFAQGSADYPTLGNTTMTQYYDDYYNFLRDNGFCFMSFYGFGNKYTGSASMMPTPYAFNCMRHCIDKLCNEYNIDKDKIVVACKSQGGYVASASQYFKYFDIKAAGLLAPALNIFNQDTIYGETGRTIMTAEFGFDTDAEWFCSNQFARNERFLNFMKANAYLMSGYNGYWNGQLGKTIETKCTETYNRTGDKNASKVIKCPVKIWVAQDDENIPFSLCDAFVTEAQNAGFDAQIRIMPNNTGKHWAVDSAENALQTTDVTTRLGIEYETVPTAYYELAQFFIEKLGLQVYTAPAT